MHFKSADEFLMDLTGVEKSNRAQLPGTLEPDEVFQCDRSQFRTDICNMKGDIRLIRHNETSSSFVLYEHHHDSHHIGFRQEVVKPYTRKWEESCMETVREVTLLRVPVSSSLPKVIQQPNCDVQHTVPGVVFSTGGYTGNLYHEFHDGLIPLFITTQHLNREVVFIVSEFHDWWFTKYSDVLEQMSKYPIISLDNETRMHCFPELEVGLHIHEELGVDPDRMPHHETIKDFRDVLSRAYTPPLGISSQEVQEEIGGYVFDDDSSRQPQQQPRLTIVVRNGTRRFLNLDGIVEAAEDMGFNVTLLIPNPTMELKRIFWHLNNTDVLIGVHGAAMTHFLFMRPGTVFIQVIPLGTDWAAFTYYGEPAAKLGLHYLSFKIEPAESSLSDKYNATDPILTDPASIVSKGWWSMKEIYLEGQDVRPSLARIRKVLQKAKNKLRPIGPGVAFASPSMEQGKRLSLSNSQGIA